MEAQEEGGEEGGGVMTVTTKAPLEVPVAALAVIEMVPIIGDDRCIDVCTPPACSSRRVDRGDRGEAN